MRKTKCTNSPTIEQKNDLLEKELANLRLTVRLLEHKNKKLETDLNYYKLKDRARWVISRGIGEILSMKFVQSPKQQKLVLKLINMKHKNLLMWIFFVFFIEWFGNILETLSAKMVKVVRVSWNWSRLRKWVEISNLLSLFLTQRMILASIIPKIGNSEILHSCQQFIL